MRLVQDIVWQITTHNNCFHIDCCFWVNIAVGKHFLVYVAKMVGEIHANTIVCLR